MTYMMILDDGETFSSLKGCKIVKVPNGWDTEQVEAALSEGNQELVVVHQFRDSDIAALGWNTPTD